MYVDLLNSGPEANLADEINIIDFRDSFRPIALTVTGSPKNTFTRLQKLHAIQKVYFLVSPRTLDRSLQSYANIGSTTLNHNARPARTVNVEIITLSRPNKREYRTYSPVAGMNTRIECLTAEIQLRVLILGDDYTAHPLSLSDLENKIKNALKIHAPNRLKINWYNSSWAAISTVEHPPAKYSPHEASALLTSQSRSPTRVIKNQPQYLSTNTDPKEHDNPKNSADPPLRFSVNADPYSSPTNTCCSTWCACWPWSSSKTIYG